MIKYDEQAVLSPTCTGNDDAGQSGGSVHAALLPEQTKLKPPPLYKVVLLNDDYTPMEFVVGVLLRFFGMNVETATRVMLKVHTEGKGVCGVYPREIAETKAVQVNEHARASEHPLLCDIEAEE
jgi:ATP-dependent Clp protease adaptor protein ClpS